MLAILKRLAHRLRSQSLAGRAVFASATIVRQGNYVPRGSIGRIQKVTLKGEYEVAFDHLPGIAVAVRPREVSAVPELARARGLLANLPTVGG